MKITQIKIENFRSIKNLEIDLSDTTVLIGANNAGKTAILDALRIVLTRKWGKTGTGFTEYDIHLESEDSDPKTSPGIKITIVIEEIVAGEWPESIQQDLDNIIQLEPVSGKSFILLQATCSWNEAEEAYVPAWTFLNAGRVPLAGQSARRLNLERFWQYLPVFYLGALRDADDEFSPRSQFWGRLLKSIHIPTELENRVKRVLDLLNTKILNADPKLANIANTLSGATEVAARDREGSVNLRMVPLKSWDLLSKAEIILKNEPDWPWLPLQKNGQGMQSLTVLFLFQAFVEHLLAEIYEPDSTAVLALEEPETHLHPQAARTLWTHITRVSGQKLVTTHSPYFVQNVPFRDLRLVKLTSQGTKVYSLPSFYSVGLPYIPAIDALIAANTILEFDRALNQLKVKGKLEENLFRALLTTYAGHPEFAEIQVKLRTLKNASVLFITDDELRSLETYARRIRGEIFFARRWFLVEGQAEYLLIHAIAKALNYPLDVHGVAVIDAVNCGNPTAFAILARAFEIPWLAVLDGDGAGHRYVASILQKDFDPAFVAQRCVTLRNGNLEQQLVVDGHEAILRQILVAVGESRAAACNQTDLLKFLDSNKTAYAAELALRISTDSVLANDMPTEFVAAINSLRNLV